MPNIQDAVIYAQEIAYDDTHGYDQENRTGPDYDCSSFVAHCLKKAGFNVDENSWTGNLRKQLLACGFAEIPVKADRKSGDIFLTEGHHVVMCVDSSRIVHASINEKGRALGGKTGDQTGKEICERSFYTPSYGWEYHFRYMPERQYYVVTDGYVFPPVLIAVANGVYGNGDERINALLEMGYDPYTIQKLVNTMYGVGNA